MIKIIFCLRRRPSLSFTEFQSYWRDRHAPLVAQRAPILGIRRYVQNSMFENTALQPAIAARKGEVPPYDGVAELWFDSVEAIQAVGNTPEGRKAGRELLEDERRFIDLPRSQLFYYQENAVLS
ncbi:EthD domain-containing protein [Novosphingobium sp. HII-3]|uniref:EthD domain-containing protein n=1 Tax=Novosphingobium sp. HII-3 TaxID=2075565 RepID=UPI000CDA92A2|nr:EthD domain-containing protein [Novosphingobium sp. HII-3]